MSATKSWKKIKREKVFDSKFLKVYQDTIQLLSGAVIDDYTLVQKPDVVMIVAITKDKKIILIREYEHGAGKMLLTLPSGHIKQGEDIMEAARRELLEETGYGNGRFSFLGSLYEYPSKDLHRVLVVRAGNVEPIKDTQHEITETIQTNLTSLNDVKSLIKNNKLQVSSVLASLALSGLL